MDVKIFSPAEIEARRKKHEADKARLLTELGVEQPRLKLVAADSAAYLTDPRAFVFRGIAFDVPPVPFRYGAECMYLQDRFNALAQPITEPLDALQMRERFRETIRIVARVAYISKRVSVPQSRARRLVWRITPNPFLLATVEEVGSHLGHFLWTVPDGPRIIDDRPGPRSWNIASDLAGFVRAFPGWVGDDGYPLSWRHFSLGMNRLARENIREQTRMARATHVGSRLTKESYEGTMQDWNIRGRDA